MTHARAGEQPFAPSFALAPSPLAVPFHRLFLGNACNLGCAFCPVTEQPRAVPARTVMQRMAAARARCASAILFTGGEPLAHKNLPAYVEAAKDAGFTDMGLRTNGVFLARGAALLARRGVTHVRVLSISHLRETHDAAARVPGAWDAARRGMAKALDAGMAVCAAIPLLDKTLPQLEEHVADLLAAFPALGGIVLRPGHTNLADTMAPADLESLLAHIADITRSAGVDCAFTPHHAPPPCRFRNPERFYTLFRTPAGATGRTSQRTKFPDCPTCPCDTLCRGMDPRHDDPALFGNPDRVSPRMAAALARLNVGGATTRFSEDGRRERFRKDNVLACKELPDERGDNMIEELILRVNYRCNQDCTFCFVDTTTADPEHAWLIRAIEKARQTRKRVRIACISGGEPTINPHLPEYVSQLAALGARDLSIQTNAVKLHRPELARELAQCGLTSAFVSLHTHDALLSDLMTGRRGSFDKTVAGILNLMDAGVFVYISHVINAFNYMQLPDFADFVGRVLHGAPIVFSFAAPHNTAILQSGVVPPLVRVRDPLREAVARCRAQKIAYAGLASHCGIPPCAVGADPLLYPDLHAVGPYAMTDDMFKNERCPECTMEPYCYGYRKLYITWYGEREIHPFRNTRMDIPLSPARDRISFFKNFYKS